MTEGTNVGVLQELDNKVPSRFYWQLTLLATLGGFLFGYDTANIGSALTVLPYKLGSFASGYLVAGASLGAAVGAFCAGPLTDRFGLAILFVARFVPETKGMSVEEITELFEEQARTHAPPHGGTRAAHAT